ncbi:MAG: Holliday junction branch migration protein RuvA [bacterium]
MLAYLSGKVIAKTNSRIIIKLPSGVGYQVNVSPSKNYLQNENIEIYILEVQRDDKTELFGFDQLDEKEWSEKLMKVSGVGPKSAANVVFSLGIAQIMQGIAQSDSKIFAQVKGLGAKTAKKIVLELKGSLADVDEINSRSETNSNFASEFVDTLSGLGYKRGEIVALISKLKKQKMWNEEDLVETVRSGLKLLSR